MITRFCHSLMVKESSTQLNRIHDILTHLHGQPPRELRLQIKPLRGGLESSAVLLVKADFKDSRGRRRNFYMVVKRLEGAAAREVSVYEHLVAQHAREIAPRLLAADHHDNGGSTLYLERVCPVSHWPWRDLSAAE